jgi:hypothetical protein
LFQKILDKAADDFGEAVGSQIDGATQVELRALAELALSRIHGQFCESILRKALEMRKSERTTG